MLYRFEPTPAFTVITSRLFVHHACSEGEVTVVDLRRIEALAVDLRKIEAPVVNRSKGAPEEEDNPPEIMSSSVRPEKI